MKEIQLTKGFIALVDDEDFERVNAYKWYASKGTRTYYAARGLHINGKHSIILMHKFILNKFDLINEIDHKDRNGLNNQKSNLRIVTSSQNKMNSPKRQNSTSKYKGVCFYKNLNKYRCRIKINGKEINLGYYKSEIEAAKVYDEKAKELFGEYANFNFYKIDQL